MSSAHQKPIGQPVLVPGDMGRYSFVLVGTEGAMEQTWGTVCHGAGRMMSRARAKKEKSFQDLQRELAERGVVMMAQGRGTALEEAPWAYKDVENVVDVCHNAGIARKIARLFLVRAGVLFKDGTRVEPQPSRKRKKVAA